MPVRLAGVIGQPISHSKSPLIHNHWLKSHGIEGLYTPLEVSPADLPTFLALAPKLGFVGLNVTIPHKEAVSAVVVERTARAERAGSVNTLSLTAEGGWRGDSTDGIGFLKNLEDRAGGWRPAGARVAMVGAGGAARAVVAALVDAGAAEIRLANRTEERCAALRDVFGAVVAPQAWPIGPEFFSRADLLVNATSLGMAGGPDWTWRLPPLSPDIVATDLIYNPLKTPFLSAAMAAGAATVDGLGMLLHQAAPGFEIWYGQAPMVTEALRTIVLETSGALP